MAQLLPIERHFAHTLVQQIVLHRHDSKIHVFPKYMMVVAVDGVVVVDYYDMMNLIVNKIHLLPLVILTNLCMMMVYFYYQ